MLIGAGSGDRYERSQEEFREGWDRGDESSFSFLGFSEQANASKLFTSPARRHRSIKENIAVIRETGLS